MKVLVIHHLEPTWSQAYINFGCTTFEELCEKTAAHIEASSYDKVILTQFEQTELENHYPYYPLIGLVNDIREYGYGWDAASMADEDEDGEPEDVLAIIDEQGEYKDRFCNVVCKGGNHSEVVLVDSWMRSLVGCEVDICGAFDGECIEDLEIALSHLKIDFNRVESLIV